jgi:hypothetical protein
LHLIAGEAVTGESAESMLSPPSDVGATGANRLRTLCPTKLDGDGVSGHLTLANSFNQIFAAVSFQSGEDVIATKAGRSCIGISLAFGARATGFTKRGSAKVVGHASHENRGCVGFTPGSGTKQQQDFRRDF